MWRLLFLVPPLFAQSPYRSAEGRTSQVWSLDTRQAAQVRPTAPRVVSKPFRPAIPAAEYELRKRPDPLRRPGTAGPPQLEVRDSSGLRAPGALPRQPLSLTPSLSWEGIAQTGFNPPSPGIAVGPSDVLLTVHNTIARYSRDGVAAETLTFEQWFNRQIPFVCPRSPCIFFDPALHYDQLHGRFLFLVSVADDVAGTSHFLLSVSNGATYASGWKIWVLDGALNGTEPSPTVLDFGQLGFDNQAVYLTGNMFNFLFTFTYAKLRILKKAELYNPSTAILTYKDFWDLRNSDNTVASSLRPVHLRGQTGDGAQPGYMVNASDNLFSEELTLWRILNPVGASPTLDRFSITGVLRYSFPRFFSQLGTARQMDPGDTRIPRLIQRNGVLYVARGAGYTDEPTTAAYERIDAASRKATLQARMVNGAFFFPAFDVPASLGPENAFPSRLVSGANVDDKGQLAYLGMAGVKAGEAPFEVGGDAGTRWGDFFSGAVDPVDGGLWVYGEYAKQRNPNEGGRWSTWAAYYPWNVPALFEDSPASSPHTPFVNLLGLWRISSGCVAAPPRFCPGASITRAEMAVFLVRSLAGDSFPFPAVPYFQDVAVEHPYFRYIQKLREWGITTGCAANRFCPGDPVTRSQMAVFVVRAKLRTVHGDNFPFPAQAYFQDVPAANQRFPFVQKLRELGITTGCAPAQFCPEEPVTRGQMAVFLSRAFLN